jgi:hypothetical protein
LLTQFRRLLARHLDKAARPQGRGLEDEAFERLVPGGRNLLKITNQPLTIGG